MTPAEIIYHRRVRLLSLADELGNVAAACREMGISHTRYYDWRRTVAAYGLEANAVRSFGGLLADTSTSSVNSGNLGPRDADRRIRGTRRLFARPCARGS